MHEAAGQLNTAENIENFLDQERDKTDLLPAGKLAISYESAQAESQSNLSDKRRYDFGKFIEDRSQIA
ncbi:hypothetical protein EDD53_2053 [Pacificibacter maritimus]|uniref:Uncharacterized protein n=1 Tax=Pacificibacter maritimus TaxID=762213 RepID=A0A3N4UGI5_9RHOB|nr:hypothetical protein [Pacificibacter maritimus]RPE66351.1 hypothetical protein EDD53_2053 [Pacificibacter maritimus]